MLKVALSCMIAAAISTSACRLRPNSGVKGSADSDMSGLIANGCITMAKKYATAPLYSNDGFGLDITQFDKELPLSDFVQLMQNGTAINQANFFYSDPSNLTTIGSFRTIKGSGLQVDVAITIDAVTADIGDQSLQSHLAIDITLDLFRGTEQFAEFVIKQKMLATTSYCRMARISETEATFAPTSDPETVTVNQVTHDLNTKSVLSKSSKAIPRSVLRNSATYDDQFLALHKGPAAPATSMTYFSARSLSIAESYTPIGTVQQVDPLTGKSISMQRFQVTTKYFDGNTNLNTAILSPDSLFYQSTHADGKVVAEVVSDDVFMKSELHTLPKTDDPYLFTFVGLSTDDLASPNLTYALGLGAPSPFDNYQAYVGVQELDGKTLPSGTPAANHWYTMTTSPQMLDLNALQAQVFAPAAPTEDQTYLKETYYLNFSDPSFQPLIQKIKAQIAAHPGLTTMNLGTYLVQTVDAHVRYDYGALDISNIQIMQASETLARHSGVCQHFAAVYVSLARAVGLPARVVSGYRLPTKGALVAGPHAWVEIKVGSTWVPFEPQGSGYNLPIQVYLPSKVDTPYEVADLNQKPDYSAFKASWAHHPVMMKMP